MENSSFHKKAMGRATGFFENMCCASYLKEQVSGEAIIDLDYDDENSIINQEIDLAFAWVEESEKGGTEECKSSNEWSSEDYEVNSECGVFSRSPRRVRKATPVKEYEFVVAEEHEHYPVKSPSGSFSTATTMTVASFNTNETWETLLTSRSSRSQSQVVEASSPPRRILVTTH